MPAVQYPFIDIAVHPSIRERFARGEAMALFSVELDRVLWANGAGADLFGYTAIYDFLDQGARPGDVSFRQIAATAHQLVAVGDTRSFLIRIAAGFQRVVANAAVEKIRTPAGEDAILFSCPVSAKPLENSERAQRMLDGFDDPDTHIAVIGRDGEIIAASPGFAALGITTETAGMLVTMAGGQPERLIKRPIRTGQGYLPAAIGRLSDTPALNLLFVVEMVIGHLDPVETVSAVVSAAAETLATPVTEAGTTADVAAVDSAGIEPTDAAVATAAETPVDAREDHADVESVPEEAATASAVPASSADEQAGGIDAGEREFAAAIDALAEIEDVEDEPEEIADIEQSEPSVFEEPEQPVTPAEHDEGDADHEIAEDEQTTVLTDEDAETHVEYPTYVSTERGSELTSDIELSADDAEGASTDDASVERELPDREPSEEQAVIADSEIEPSVPAASEPEVALDGSADIAQPAAGADAVAASAPETDQPQHFVFNRQGRATRFVWKIDAEGHFSEISREFAEAVGPHAKALAGVAFADIAALFHLDPDGKIAELLARRDTWSGRTIHWPVEGTTLTVPVDLAALPTYTRSREFDGFRGFGVVRLSDAAEDPLRTGLTLGLPATADAASGSQTAEELPSQRPDEEEPVADPIVFEESNGENETTAGETETVPDSVEPFDKPSERIFEPNEPELPFHVEPPALKIAETPARRLSDKIIQLHERRQNLNDGLSLAEQAAFREIAKQLEPFGKRGEEPEGPTDAAPVGPTDDESVQPDAPEVEIEAFYPTALQAANDDIQGSETPEPADAAEGREGGDEFNALDVLNTAIPPRVKMTDGLSASVVDQLPVAVLVHAGDTLIHANPEFMRLTGYASLAELDGVGGIDALLQREDLQDKTERSGVMMVVRADDALVPVTARLQSIRWEDASALMLALMPVEKDGETLLATRIDSREEPRPERMLEKVAKLQVEVEELQSILETATDGVAIIGPEGDIRSMNRSASALFNYDEQETRGKPFVMLFAHESQKAVLDYLSGLTGNGVASVLNDGREVIGREASGGFVPLFMTMGVLTSSNGYCAVIRDITQWKRTEEDLRNAKRAAETANAHKSDFLARVSHEIRTPLNAIIGFSDMMASERLGPMGHARYVEYAGDIGRSGRHVLDIVNDLLDISKIEAGEMELEFGAVGLNEAIAEAVSIVQPQANGQRVIIRTGLSQSVPNVVADLRSIKQIALNILSNAIRFTPSGGQIVVSTSYEGNGSVVLRIRDTGVGMTRTELEQAMKPFRQVATNSRQRGDGTGLGLPLTKAMVDANRALFSIHSAPNEGTLVEVTFPSPRVLAD
ncbi:ATP-binding protein [Rhizobium tumorigenes]|uniref:ATP-binding protein n=1 Tax=Rhizobium tumorigenes TaxID=2041385 RepID=UPI00241D077C|nr:ATP-binding protein [Rhizobium tumorigenes]WFS01317.1 PAS domain S-box protein [Rhizobium tumorigenes]